MKTKKVKKSKKEKYLEKMLDVEAQMFDLKNLEDKYTFFYDETNNIRKLYINDNNQLNVPVVSNFVLGGVVCDESNIKFDFVALKEKLKLHKNVIEIKTHNVAKGNFKESISSKKLNIFLTWLIESRINIHYLDIDPIYWSIVDIVDSIISEIPHLHGFHTTLKAELNEVVKNNLDYFITLLAKYNYPNISKINIKKFAEDILQLVENHEYLGSSEEGHFNYMMLKGVIQMAREKKSLPFIQGYKERLLIDEFAIFYANRILRFRNSFHNFDNEPIIVERIRSSDLIFASCRNRFGFYDSQIEVGIQASDVTVGILGKLFTYMRLNNIDDLIKFRRSLDVVASENLYLLNKVMDRSSSQCKAFINRVGSIYDREKESILLK